MRRTKKQREKLGGREFLIKKFVRRKPSQLARSVEGK